MSKEGGKNPAFEKKKEEVVKRASELAMPAEYIGEDDDDVVIEKKSRKHELDVYKCIVRMGADGLNHVPKVGIPAAELIMLQLVHGSEFIKDVKMLNKKAVIVASDLQWYLRDYLAQRYTMARVEFLWGNGLTGQDLPLVINDIERTGAMADQQRARLPDDGLGANAKRIA